MILGEPVVPIMPKKRPEIPGREGKSCALPFRRQAGGLVGMHREYTIPCDTHQDRQIRLLIAVGYAG